MSRFLITEAKVDQAAPNRFSNLGQDSYARRHGMGMGFSDLLIALVPNMQGEIRYTSRCRGTDSADEKKDRFNEEFDGVIAATSRRDEFNVRTI